METINQIKQELLAISPLLWCESNCKQVLDKYDAEVLNQNMEPAAITFAIYAADPDRTVAIEKLCASTEENPIISHSGEFQMYLVVYS